MSETPLNDRDMITEETDAPTAPTGLAADGTANPNSGTDTAATHDADGTDA